jgi:hypothetical protein
MYRLDLGLKPLHIQSAKPDGQSIPLPFEDKESSEVLPDWLKLQTEKQHKALSAVLLTLKGKFKS